MDEGCAVEGVLDLLATEGVVEEDMMRESGGKRVKNRQFYTSRQRKEGGTMDGGSLEGMGHRPQFQCQEGSKLLVE